MIFHQLTIGVGMTRLACFTPAFISLSDDALSPLILLILILVLTVGLIHSRKGQTSAEVDTNTGLQAEIEQLKKQLLDRNNELKNMREALAADFHDETGNLLSVVMHQTNMLKLKAPQDLQPIITNILDSTTRLSASTRDFLWYIHCDREEPKHVLNYLTDFGQSYFSKFDISFSVEITSKSGIREKLKPSAVLNLVFIFKEAMTNVIRHSAASEVKLLVKYNKSSIVYSLIDDGCWKVRDSASRHNGLRNIAARSEKNNFTYSLSTGNACTRIDITVPCREINTDHNAASELSRSGISNN